MTAVEDCVRIGKALADPTRVRLLTCLEKRDLCVCELVHLMAAGQPAVSLPLHVSGDGLPIGIQLVAAYGDEATLIRLATQLGC